MNNVMLIGYLGRDPEIMYVGETKETQMCSFSIGVNRLQKKDGKSVADFINCIAFGKIAEVVNQYCQKGTKVAVEGSWQTGTYVNKEGQKVYTNKCLVRRVEFCGSTKTTEKENDYNDFIPPEDDTDLPF